MDMNFIKLFYKNMDTVKAMQQGQNLIHNYGKTFD